LTVEGITSRRTKRFVGLEEITNFTSKNRRTFMKPYNYGGKKIHRW